MSNIKYQILKLILSLLVGVFAFEFLVTSTLAVAKPTPLPTPTPERVDYFLVYPGILPDHFLYSVKMVRDRVLTFLTVDPLKKAELFLLFADKRLGAGKALIEGNKTDLGVSTISKAEKYLEQAVNQAKIAGQNGKDSKIILEKLNRATRKHEEVILDLITKVSGDAKSTLEKVLEYPRKLT
jgi:hypothetical protein